MVKMGDDKGKERVDGVQSDNELLQNIYLQVSDKSAVEES